MTGCYLYREAPIVWYWENEMYESLGVLDNYCVYDYSVPFKGIMESYESVPAHYQILLPPKKEIRNILWGPSEDICFLFTKNRGIAIIQDLHDWERKYENGLNQITTDMAENQLLKFADLLGKEVKVKGKKEHYMYVDNEIRILMFNLTEEDCSLKTKSGSAFQLNDRIGWCRQWLRRALFIEIPQRGIYSITQRGKDYLQSHTDLRQEDLLQYPEYAEYAHMPVTSKVDSTGEKKDIEEKLGKMTPTEQMDVAFKSINDDLAADLLQRVLDMSPNFFEKLVLDLLLNMGFGSRNKEMAIVTPTSHDNGVDGIIPEDALGLDKIYIQAKRYTDNPVSKPEIHKFIGALDEQKATKGVFITTSKFTSGAVETANKASKKIVLIDGKSLADYMIEYNVGVSEKKIYEVKKLDSDYFEE
jgi:restriction system protein